MARAAPKSKKSKPAPKSKKVEVEETEPEVKSEEEHEETEESAENNGNTQDESDGEEPPAKKGRGRKPKAGKKTPAKKGAVGGRASSRARKTPAAKKDESEDEDDGKEYEVQSILEDRTRKGSKEYLVKWKGYSKGDSTWEPESNLNCDDIIKEYEEKKLQNKNTPGKELREGRKQTDRYADIAGSGQDHKKRHSRRNAKSPRKTYKENPDSD